MSLHARKDTADRSAPAGRTEAAAVADILLNPAEHNPTLLGATSDLCLLILSPPCRCGFKLAHRLKVFFCQMPIAMAEATRIETPLQLQNRRSDLSRDDSDALP